MAPLLSYAYMPYACQEARIYQLKGNRQRAKLEKGDEMTCYLCPCTCRYRLKDVERFHLADIWQKYARDRFPVDGLDVDAAYNAVHLISQVSILFLGAGC